MADLTEEQLRRAEARGRGMLELSLGPPPCITTRPPAAWSSS